MVLGGADGTTLGAADTLLDEDAAGLDGGVSAIDGWHWRVHGRRSRFHLCEKLSELLLHISVFRIINYA